MSLPLQRSDGSAFAAPAQQAKHVSRSKCFMAISPGDAADAPSGQAVLVT
jgi:hypothetical protein